MNILISTSGVAIDEQFGRLTRERIEQVLERIKVCVRGINLHISVLDETDRDGRMKTECRLVVQLQRQSSLVVVEYDFHTPSLVNRVIERLRDAAGRKLGKLEAVNPISRVIPRSKSPKR